MKINKNDVDKFLSILSEGFQIYAPILKDGVAQFDIWKSGDEMFLEGFNTINPPKDILFPNYEEMYKYKTGPDAYIKEVVPEETEKIIFGIRPCDVRSIESLDKVFFTKEYVDSYYAKRREHVATIAFGCVMTQETCFCSSMGLDPNEAPAADIMMNAGKDDTYIIETQTERGKEILEKAKSVLEEGGEAEKNTKCRLEINKPEDLDVILADMFEDEIWAEVTEACIGCGTCTYVCPTCYCFDIDNENFSSEGCKYRCWDSCMFSDYTRMAGGHNPRPTKKERLRNRYMHKLSYFNERYGETLCTGCGRCIQKCPAHLDISEFIEKVAEKKNAVKDQEVR